MSSWDQQQQQQFIYSWEIATGKIRSKRPGHLGFKNYFSFSPNGKLLATAGQDIAIFVWDLTGAYLAPPQAPDGKKMDDLWNTLGDLDAEKAFRAMGTLVAYPIEALALFGGKIFPIREDPGQGKAIRDFIADLDDPQFKKRENAMIALIQLGPKALPELRQALKVKGGIEGQRRMENVVKQITDGPLPTDVLRHIRAVEVLENIGTASALARLRELGSGAPSARLTQEAAAAVRRLETK